MALPPASLILPEVRILAVLVREFTWDLKLDEVWLPYVVISLEANGLV